MQIQPKRFDFDYLGYKVLVKANPSSTTEGAWFPSYQISNEAEQSVQSPVGWVNGSADWEWVLQEGERLAKEQIHALLTA